MSLTETPGRQDSLLKLTERFDGEDTIRFTEEVTKKPYESLSEEVYIIISNRKK